MRGLESYCIEEVKMYHLPRNSGIKNTGRMLRKNMTKAERHLWYDFLRSYKVQFYRQRTIGSYILDFYCPSVKLAIELDGSQHFENTNIKSDEIRTEYLNDFGITVLRFWNYEIYKSFEYVCKVIDTVVTELNGEMIL